MRSARAACRLQVSLVCEDVGYCHGARVELKGRTEGRSKAYVRSGPHLCVRLVCMHACVICVLYPEAHTGPARMCVCGWCGRRGSRFWRGYPGATFFGGWRGCWLLASMAPGADRGDATSESKSGRARGSDSNCRLSMPASPPFPSPLRSHDQDPSH